MNRITITLISGWLTSAALMAGMSAGTTAPAKLDANSADLMRMIVQEEECVHSQGFWKRNTDEWPVDELTLGSETYDQEQLLSILNNPPRGNGLVILARQLITAKLNVADGANTPQEIHDAIADADALIGDLVVPPVGDGWLHPSMTGELNDTLSAYNDGELHDEDCELIDEPERD